jgi:hypothetical protein
MLDQSVYLVGYSASNFMGSACSYDWQKHKVTDLRDGVFYATRFASPQGALIPLNLQESLIVYRPQTGPRQARKSRPTQQLVLFELVRTG